MVTFGRGVSRKWLNWLQTAFFNNILRANGLKNLFSVRETIFPFLPRCAVCTENGTQELVPETQNFSYTNQKVKKKFL